MLVRVNGERVRVRLPASRRVRVDLRGLECGGYYPALAQLRGVRSALRVYKILSARRVRYVRR